MQSGIVPIDIRWRNIVDDVMRTNPISSLVKRGAYHARFFEGKVRLIGFGPRYSPGGIEVAQNWSLRDFQTVEVPEAVDRSTTSIGRYLPDIAYLLGAEGIYAPQPTAFNAKVCREEDLTDLIKVDNGRHTVALHRGALADGIIQSAGHISAGSFGGCPLILSWRKEDNMLGFIHAGMRSLIDEERVQKLRKVYRTHESVVDAIVSQMGGRKSAPDLRAVIAFPIPPELFTYY